MYSSQENGNVGGVCERLAAYPELFPPCTINMFSYLSQEEGNLRRSFGLPTCFHLFFFSSCIPLPLSHTLFWLLACYGIKTDETRNFGIEGLLRPKSLSQILQDGGLQCTSHYRSVIVTDLNPERYGIPRPSHRGDFWNHNRQLRWESLVVVHLQGAEPSADRSLDCVPHSEGPESLSRGLFTDVEAGVM